MAKDRFERAKAAEELMLDEIKASLTGDANVASQNASLYADALGDLITGVTSAFAKAENWKPTFDWNNGIIRVDILEAMQQELLQLNLGLENIYDALTELLSAKFGSHSELDGIGHLISTQTISGVGASSVGVAGSVAITIVDSLSEASIAGRDSFDADELDIEVDGALLVEANEAQQVYTTASASADKSLGDAAKAASANTAGSSVGVGASFALNLIDARVIARIGTETVIPGEGDAEDTVTAQSNRNIQAGSLAIKATFRDDVDTVVVAGSDPIARRDKAYIAMRTLGMENPMDAINKANIGTNTKNISADAAVAVAIVENEVKAELLSGGRLTTTATADTIETGILTGVDAVGNDVFEMANVLLQALYGGNSYTGVSAFAAGGRAAVGVAVGYTQTESDIRAALESDTEASGSVRAYAATDVTDEMNALASSVGADLDRILQ